MLDRVKFATLVEDLITQIEGDLDDPEWVKKRYMKKMRDADRAVYEVLFLTLQKGRSDSASTQPDTTSPGPRRPLTST